MASQQESFGEEGDQGEDLVGCAAQQPGSLDARDANDYEEKETDQTSQPDQSSQSSDEPPFDLDAWWRQPLGNNWDVEDNGEWAHALDLPPEEEMARRAAQRQAQRQARRQAQRQLNHDFDPLLPGHVLFYIEDIEDEKAEGGASWLGQQFGL